MNRSFMDHTEILDDDFVDILNAPKVVILDSKKSSFSCIRYIKYFLLFLVLGFMVFQSYQMNRVSASIRSINMDVEKKDLYQYKEVSFPDMDYSYSFGN